jgi:DNA-binding NarL/FixJ family response regulator
VNVFVIDAHAIYRRGLVACLQAMEDVDDVHEAGSLRDAWRSGTLVTSDVVVVDPDLPGGAPDVIRQLRDAAGAYVVACSALCDEADIVTAVEAGAVGYLRKETLTPDALAAGVRAAASGSGVMAPEILGTLLRGISRAAQHADGGGPVLARLSERERDVLRLVAQGLPTREVAAQLCYSERTIKNVIHDAVTKLNARTRSQAVAHAMRDGLI